MYSVSIKTSSKPPNTVKFPPNPLSISKLYEIIGLPPFELVGIIGIVISSITSLSSLRIGESEGTSG